MVLHPSVLTDFYLSEGLVKFKGEVRLKGKVTLKGAVRVKGVVGNCRKGAFLL